MRSGLTPNWYVPSDAATLTNSAQDDARDEHPSWSPGSATCTYSNTNASEWGAEASRANWRLALDALWYGGDWPHMMVEEVSERFERDYNATLWAEAVALFPMTENVTYDLEWLRQHVRSNCNDHVSHLHHHCAPAPRVGTARPAWRACPPPPSGPLLSPFCHRTLPHPSRPCARAFVWVLRRAKGDLYGGTGGGRPVCFPR